MRRAEILNKNLLANILNATAFNCNTKTHSIISNIDRRLNQFVKYA